MTEVTNPIGALLDNNPGLLGSWREVSLPSSLPHLPVRTAGQILTRAGGALLSTPRL